MRSPTAKFSYFCVILIFKHGGIAMLSSNFYSHQKVHYEIGKFFLI